MAPRAPALLFVLLVGGALLAAACEGGDEPPPRNPLADTATPAATGAATAMAAATQPPTLTPTASPEEPVPPPAEALEVATGSAIELMAEWLGVSATDLSVAEAEALVWPSGCLGVAEPGVLCTLALVPGFRIVLRDAFDGLHRVHASTQGAVRWAGEAVVSGTIAAVEGAAITIDAPDGQLVALASPGTRYSGVDGPTSRADLEALAADLEGLRVTVAVDPSPTGAALRVLAWLALVE